MFVYATKELIGRWQNKTRQLNNWICLKNNLEWLQWMESNWKASTQQLRVTKKSINIKKLLLYMIIRVRKILQERLKIKKKYAMVMCLCMNGENINFIQHMNASAQHRRGPSRIWKILCIYKNIWDWRNTWHKPRHAGTYW